MRKLLIGTALTMASLICAAADQAIVDRYNKTCVMCHASGVANAPKTGSAEDWKPHLAKGMDTLVANVKKGINAMPPKGMCNDCSDADYKALIQYMSTAKK
jgi:cytochrome c5